MFRYIIIATILFFSSISNLYATPTISNGVVVNELLTISGSSFGSGGTVILFDSFENGEDESNVVGESIEFCVGNKTWANGYGVVDGVTHKYTNDIKYCGSLSYRHTVTADNSLGSEIEGWNSCIEVDFGLEQEVTDLYFAFDMRLEYTGDLARQVKLPRIVLVETYNDPPTIGITYQQSSESWSGYFNDGTSFRAGIETPPSQITDTWQHFVFRDTLGTEGVEDGFFGLYQGLSTELTESNPALTRDTGCGLFGRLSLTNVHQMNPYTSGIYNYYFDNVYLSEGQSRIEIGDNSTYTSCTKRFILPYSAWGETEISVIIKSTYHDFPNGATAYLFVIDSDGNASAGYPITIGAQSGNGTTSTGIRIKSQFNVNGLITMN